MKFEIRSNERRDYYTKRFCEWYWEALEKRLGGCAILVESYVSKPKGKKLSDNLIIFTVEVFDVIKFKVEIDKLETFYCVEVKTKK